MPAKIESTSLRFIEKDYKYADLYEIEKDNDHLPYKACLRKPLKPNCEYIGHAFTMHVYHNIDYDEFKIPNNVSDDTHVPGQDLVHVKYHKYKINCSNDYYKPVYVKQRERFVRRNEFAAGPYFALMVLPKPVRPLTLLEDIMMEEDPLYSTMDTKRALVGRQITLPETEFAFSYFTFQKLAADPNVVRLAMKKMLNSTERMKSQDAYLNIVHDCDRYCTISSIGTLFDDMTFRKVKKDGLRCVRALIELPYSETYRSPHSVLNDTKGDPHNDRISLAQPYYALMKQYNTLLANDPSMLQISATHDDQASGTNYTVIAIGCIVPVLIGGAVMAYIARASNGVAQRIRNKIASITQMTHGMRRVNTSDESDMHEAETQ